jgi:hypothetical protein
MSAGMSVARPRCGRVRDRHAAGHAPITCARQREHIARPAVSLEPPGHVVKIAVALMTPLVAGLAILGAIGSFDTVRTLAAPWFGDWAWIVPLGVDAGILALLGWDLLAEYMRLPWPVLRWTAWGFISATVYLNIVAARGNLTGSIMHAAMPTLFITVIEGIRHLIRQWTGLAAGSRIERIPASRWLLAPRSSFLVARHMILWQITSFRQALCLEHARLASISRLKQDHGRWRWRWRAPLAERLALRLPSEEDLTISGISARIAILSATTPLTSTAAGEIGGSPAAVSPARAGDDSQLSPGDTADEESPGRDHRLITDAREIAEEARRRGVRLSQASLARQLRGQGHRIANERLRWLATTIGIGTERRLS